MTFDILLVALAALVLSNVVLLVAATRSGTLGRSATVDEGAANTAARDARKRPTPAIPSAGTGRSTDGAPVVPGGSIAVAAGRESDEGPRTASPPAIVLPEPTLLPEPTAPPDPGSKAGEPPDLGAGTPQRSDAPAGSRRGRSSGSGATRAGGTKGGRGRRFTLPSIEVDHARTERVMLSLLTGDDEVPQGEMVGAWERMVGTDADSTAGRAAVVVALTLDGLDRLTEAAGRDSAERLVGTVLDAIRRSARASDRVASVGRGHFRVLLVDADEAVATRFVGRVRASSERRLVMAAAPVTLAAGWSEAASADRLEGAVRAAEERRRADAASGRRRTGDSNPA